MPSPLQAMKTNAHYAFIAVGAMWLALAVYLWSGLLIWPVVALVAGGAMLKLLPRRRLTWAWVASATMLGLVVALYQVYEAIPFLMGTFSIVAIASLALFAVFGAAHLLLLYVGSSALKAP